MIDFQEHLTPHIAQRFKDLRSNSYYKIPPETISNGQKSAILRIEKGQNTKSGNFITDTLLDDYVDYFQTSREELIFGTSEEIETLLARTFTNVIYPIFPHSPEKQEEIDATLTPTDLKIQKTILELTHTFADFGRWWNLRRGTEEENKKDFHVDHHVMHKILWLICKNKMIHSFKHRVLTSLFNDSLQKFHYNRINKEIHHWLLHDFSEQLIPEITEKLKQNSIFKIGYMVKNLIDELLTRDLPVSHLKEIPLKEFYLPTKTYSFRPNTDKNVTDRAIKQFAHEFVEFQEKLQDVKNLKDFEQIQGITNSACVTTRTTPLIDQTVKVNIDEFLDEVIDLPEYYSEDHVLDYPMLKVPGILTVNSQASNLFQDKFNKSIEYSINDLVRIQNAFINCIKHEEIADFVK